MEKIKKAIMPDGEELAVRDKELEDGTITDSTGKKYVDIKGHLRSDSGIFATGLKILSINPTTGNSNAVQADFDTGGQYAGNVKVELFSDGKINCNEIFLGDRVHLTSNGIDTDGGIIKTSGGSISLGGGDILANSGTIDAGVGGRFVGGRYNTDTGSGYYAVGDSNVYAVLGSNSMLFKDDNAAIVVDGSMNTTDDVSRKLWLGIISTAQATGSYPSINPDVGIIARIDSGGKKYVDVYAERMVGRTEGSRCEFDVVRAGTKLVLADSEGNAYDVTMDTLNDYLSKSEGGVVNGTLYAYNGVQGYGNLVLSGYQTGTGSVKLQAFNKGAASSTIMLNTDGTIQVYNAAVELGAI